MEREIKNNVDNIDIDTSVSNARLEGLAASEMADRGPKTVDTTKNDWSHTDGRTNLMGISNPGKEAGNDEDDDDDDDMDFDDEGDDLDVAAPAVTEIDSPEIDDTAMEDDLDIELDDDDEEEEEDI